MGRGKRGLFDDLAIAPWPVGVVVGLVGFVGLRFLLPTFIASNGSPLAQAFTQSNPFAPFAWIFLALCCAASFASFVGSRRKRRLLDTRTGLDSIATLGWRDFERLVGEAFRRQGYTVEETGLGGADGGIDLILRRNGQRTLVQCKHWRRQKVPVNVVREMFGLLAHHNAHAVRIAASGGFTPDAARFAQDKPIALINGETLLGMIREVQADRTVGKSPIPSAHARLDPLTSTTGPAPDCPRCGTQSKDGRQVLGLRFVSKMPSYALSGLEIV